MPRRSPAQIAADPRRTGRKLTGRVRKRTSRSYLLDPHVIRELARLKREHKIPAQENVNRALELYLFTLGDRETVEARLLEIVESEHARPSSVVSQIVKYLYKEDRADD